VSVVRPWVGTDRDPCSRTLKWPLLSPAGARGAGYAWALWGKVGGTAAPFVIGGQSRS
jgi:hypothetical protein